MAAISYGFPSSSLLGSVRMVGSSAVMGHDALQSTIVASSGANAQVTGNTLAAKLTRSKTTRDVKDVAFRMVHISSCCFLSALSWLSTGWALLKSLADFPKGLSFASSFFQLQRLSSERTRAGYGCRNNATVERRPEAVGWAPSVLAGPLTTSLRGLWVSGVLPPGNGGTYEGAATQKPTK